MMLNWILDVRQSRAPQFEQYFKEINMMLGMRRAYVFVSVCFPNASLWIHMF